MYDIIMYRGECHEQLKEMASYSKVPVINGFTAYQHPTQMLADFMALEEAWVDGINKFSRRLQEQLDSEIAAFVKDGFEVTDEVFEKNSHIIFREA